MSCEYKILNMDTGEFIGDYNIKDSDQNIKLYILNAEVDEMIKPGKRLIADELKKLIQLMYASGEINKEFFQIRLGGKFVSDKTFEIMASESDHMAAAFAKLMHYTSWNNRVKKTDTSVCTNWKELHEVCEIKGKRHQAQFKKLLTVHNIVKKAKTEKGVRMFVNPNMKRKGSHASQDSILAFWEDTKSNISIYAKMLFYSYGYISKEDI